VQSSGSSEISATALTRRGRNCGRRSPPCSRKQGLASSRSLSSPGLVEVDHVVEGEDAEIEDILFVFLQKLGDVLARGQAYPLFDDETGSLVSSGIAEGLIAPTGDSLSRGKQIGAAAELMSHLPALPSRQRFRGTRHPRRAVRTTCEVPIGHGPHRAADRLGSARAGIQVVG
jgi:hypothetical protein